MGIHYERNHKKREIQSSFSKHFEKEAIEEVTHFLASFPNHKPTPLCSLQRLATELGVESIHVKDESKRFRLNAFKATGGLYAVSAELANTLDVSLSEITFSDLRVMANEQEPLTFITATDGNHGRGVAFAASQLGQKSIVYMPKGSSEERLKAIQAEGASAEITDVNYDEAVRMASYTAEKFNYALVQDTAWQGYEEIPLRVMQGYATIAYEIVEELARSGQNPPTHVFLQAGVGSFAAAIATFLYHAYGEQSPKVILVEPDQAHCYYLSFKNQSERTIVDGDMETIMAGLACGEPSTIAFELLQELAEGAFSCTDDVAALGMRMYANPIKEDERITSGESGAVTLGLVYRLLHNKELESFKDQMGLNETSRVLLINTEGDTDVQTYREVVWEGKHS
ncbi:diaminopropionate ammonia-lyase [Geomicrobium sediminis]|uniref:Diaminopropionate ammonia-lyase n=1 Tax=Geomicrobium sediminis TaxID=1347788 RepID=A0ABS2PCU4_9BACL|nr:diaminopropionate ammonia-lyase [Geomicrobium sediminis]MBM7633161.1 diaminopropionate ammonia-lyase [Geomicrobium sediminis]